MNEELQKELAGLASKLGTTTEHLWGVLVRQAYIDGVSSLLSSIVCVFLGLGAIGAFYGLRRKLQNTPSDQLPQPFPAVLLGPSGWGLLAIVLLILLMILSDSLYWVISDFFNPEFFALRHLPFSK
jgi:hypothetical protein